MGAAVGALAGFLYWKFKGCDSGTCGITTDPWRSTFYFAALGSLLFGIFKKDVSKDPAKEPGTGSGM